MLPPSQSGVPAGGRSFSKLEIHARQLFDPYKDPLVPADLCRGINHERKAARRVDD